jgi:aryl-alcohol dehydrogenase-like predicted oxidoreductase
MQGKVVISTKGGHPPMDNMEVNRVTRDELTKDIDESLRYLGVDSIDLWWLHKDNIHHPIGDILETLNDALRAGKIRNFGCSNMKLPRLLEADACALKQGIRSFCGVQLLWSYIRANPCVFDDPRIAGMDEALHDHCRTTNRFAFCFTSQARGFMERVNQNGIESLEGWVRASYESPDNMARLQRARELAGELNTSLASIGLAFLTSQPFPTIPLMGCLSPAELESSMKAADLVLTKEQIRFLIGDAETL